jgi:hypothetical protein
LLYCFCNTIFFSAVIFSNRRNKNPQKINVFLLVQNRRNFTPQKLPVIRYMVCLNGSVQHVQVFFLHLFILKIQLSRRCVIQLIGLTPPELCACPKPGYVSPTPKVVVFYIVFNDLRWEVSTRVVDIGGMGFLAITVWTIFS